MATNEVGQGTLVSVVIVNYNRREALSDALGSVYDQTHRPLEVIVVDNASCDDSVEMLRTEYPSVRVISLDENLAMAGYSAGFREARGEIVFQMDNDSLLPDRTVLAEVVDRFHSSNSDVAVIATRVEEFRPATSSVELIRSTDSRRGPIEARGYHAGGVGFRRDALRRTSYYDPDVFLYGSELFLEMQLLALGYSILFFPEILVLHLSASAARSSKAVFYEIRNRYWFMRRFATTGQLFRYLPSMLLHDLIYGPKKASLGVFLTAVRQGLGERPPALRERVLSPNRQFSARVDEIGKTFSIGATVRRSLGYSRYD